MVILDQDRIIERVTVIGAAAAAHGVFLERPQPRRRLARIANLRAGARHRIGIFTRQGRDTAQMVEEVQGYPFCRHHQPGRARHPRNHPPDADPLAIGHLGREDHAIADQPKRCRRQVQPGDHARLARRDIGRRHGFGRQRRLAGQVARQPQVFFKRRSHRPIDQQARQLGRQTVHRAALSQLPMLYAPRPAVATGDRT